MSFWVVMFCRAVRAMNEAMKQERLSKDQDHYGGERNAIADEKEQNVSDNHSEYVGFLPLYYEFYFIFQFCNISRIIVVFLLSTHLLTMA